MSYHYPHIFPDLSILTMGQIELSGLKCDTKRLKIDIFMTNLIFRKVCLEVSRIASTIGFECLRPLKIY